MIILDRVEVLSYFPKLKRPNEALFDARYWCPTEDWLKEWYRNYRARNKWKPVKPTLFNRMFRRHALWVWQHRNDCDNFSLRAVAASMELFEWTDPKITGEAQTPAVFEIIGDIGSEGECHAMNAVLVDEGGIDPVLYFVEPQETFLVLTKPRYRLPHVKYVRG